MAPILTVIGVFVVVGALVQRVAPGRVGDEPEPR
jgi:hypothetical protein